MKRLFKFMTCLVMGLVMCTMAVSSVACSCSGDEWAEDVVKFTVWDSGWGTDGYQAIVDRFNEKSEAEGYGFTVQFDYNATQNNIKAEFASGTSDIDIFSCPISSVEAYAFLEPLDDILDQKYGDESKTLREKFSANHLAMMEADDSVGMLPVTAGVNGIVYNKALFAEAGASVPRTTDELTELVFNSKFNNDSHKSWIHFKDGYNGYYPYIMSVWTAQYMGYENYYKLTKLENYTDYNGNTVEGYENILRAKDGRYEMLQVLDDVLENNNVAEGHSSADFTIQQLAFLEGKAMMMINGNWLGQEMQKNGGNFDGEKFGMMKTPVISSIINNMPDSSIEDDEELCAIIDAVDAGEAYDAESSDYDCSEADFNRVKEARGMMCSGGCASGLYIANYSNVVDKAKKFVQFFYSDEAGTIWRNTKKCQSAAAFSDETLDDSFEGWSSWDKEVDKLYKDTTHPIGTYRERSDFYVKNGQEIWLGVDCINPLVNISGKKTADQLWQDMQTRMDQNWDNWYAAIA